MKKIYKGYELEVTREDNAVADGVIFWSIMRIEDGYECASGFSYDSDTVWTWIKTLKERVDNEHKEDDPWCEKEGLNF